ncbi:MAG TPA: AAA-like domain-containing protein [Waterburya sp.]|jgi:hypothetical protein
MMGIEAVLAFANQLIYIKTGEHLSDLQRVILRESWQETKKTYDQMAQEYGYSPNYIKQVVAPRLWRLLSQGLEEKVTKTNIRSVLERRMASRIYPNPQELLAAEIFLRNRDNQLVEEPTEATTLPPIEPPSSQQPKDQSRTLAAPVHNLNNSLAAVELEFPDGSVPLNSPFYVERIPHDSRCYQELLKPGALIRIKGPRQMGKTSLMNRILVRAIEQNYKTVLLDFQQAEETVLDNLNKLLRWFCANLTRQLKLEPKLDEYWDEDLGSKMSCTFYIEEHLLEPITNPMVLALEEVSVLFERATVAQEFLSLLRSWHERAKVDSIWQKLRLVLVQSTEVYVPLDINQSPFNVGLGIDLEPLTPQQIQDLTQRHGLRLNADQFARLMQLVAGHPYLVRLTLYHLIRQELTLEELLKAAATDTGIFSNHLHRHLKNLQQHPELTAAFSRVLSTTEPVELEQVQGFKLQSMGLVKLLGNRVTLSCDLYQQYFGVKLNRVGDNLV